MFVFASDKGTYIIDLMFVYVNDYKPRRTKINLLYLLHHLYEGIWLDDESDDYISPISVILNPGAPQFSHHIKRIRGADYNKYPIFVLYDKDEYTIVDGYHRLAKCVMNKDKEIPAYVFTAKEMAMFKLPRHIPEDVNLSHYELTMLYNKQVKRICK